MQPIFSTSNIKKIEVAAAKAMGIPMFELMLRAGQAAFDLLQKQWPQAKQVFVVTGSGNNAGDGLILAELAQAAGYHVTLVALRDYGQLTHDAQLAWQRVQPLNLPIISLEDADFSAAEVIVDAILGTGFQGSLSEPYQQAIERINQAVEFGQVSVLALDIASGVYADTGLCADTVINAEHTISFIFLKLAQVMNDSLAYQGQLHLARLGVEQSQFYGEKPSLWQHSLEDVMPLIPRRKATTYKNQCGHVLCVGGNHDMGGAILLSAETALKSGAGMVTCHTHSDNRSAGFARCPEIMWRGNSIGGGTAELIEQQFQALILGPGLGRDNSEGELSWGQQQYEYYSKALQTGSLKAVIDADGLYWLAKQPLYFKPSQVVLTPHIGEAARLLSCESAMIDKDNSTIDDLCKHDISKDRLAAAKKIALKYGAVCLLKGAGTIISDGQSTVVTAGAHPAMASAGLGDVLSGLIGALLAQGLNAWDAACLAANIHFQAGIIAAQGRTRGMVASELIEPINQLLNQ
ncbi:MAG: NAD(P)H-hydrate dehydratase [Kangiellaceae bacterium]|nr:NAD(P)H-hydrate dehydratase [Kangiellaceae bacterium]